MGTKLSEKEVFKAAKKCFGNQIDITNCGEDEYHIRFTDNYSEFSFEKLEEFSKCIGTKLINFTHAWEEDLSELTGGSRYGSIYIKHE